MHFRFSSPPLLLRSSFWGPKPLPATSPSHSNALRRSFSKRPSLVRRFYSSHSRLEKRVLQFLDLRLEKVIQTSEDLRNYLTSKHTLDVTQTMLNELSLVKHESFQAPTIDARGFLVAYALSIFPHLLEHYEASTNQSLQKSAHAFLSSFIELLSDIENASYIQHLSHSWNSYKLAYEKWKSKTLTRFLNVLTHEFLYLDSNNLVEQWSVLKQLYRYGGMQAVERLVTMISV